jgi:predicted flap endonuclease-1-like 5' DNA nuclease
VSDEKRTDIEEDPVLRRIARILDAKRGDNEQVLGALKGAVDAWEGLNKEVDTAIGAEFDLLTTEREAVLAAQKRLKKPATLPSDEGFVVGGRIFEKEKKAGLPHVVVRVVREREGKEEVLAETITDEMGNFRGLVPAALLEGARDVQETLRIEALTGPQEKPLLVTTKSVRMKAGRAEELDLAVAPSRKLADRVAAAESVRDSVEESVQSVERRLASMKTAHTAVTRFAELTRDGLEALRRDLSVNPPVATAAVAVAGIEPIAQEGGGGTATAGAPFPLRQPAAPTTSTPLEHVRGIGPKRAARLRAAGIPDLEAFLRTDMATLVRILGFDAHVAKEEAERALAEHEAARKKRRAKKAGTRKS